MYTPGIEGQCPRCMSALIDLGTWSGIVNLTDIDDPHMSVHKCVTCGYYEDAVIRANRMAQHQQATAMEVGT